jgi:hypothetical protein
VKKEGDKKKKEYKIKNKEENRIEERGFRPDLTQDLLVLNACRTS